MDDQQRRTELADFLRTRRSRLSPTQVGLPQGSRRRVPGLRREEVAELANIGVTWYTWLEQARPVNVSPQTIEQIAQALRLDQYEREHLFLLAGQSPPLEPPSTTLVTAPMQQVLDSLGENPAYIVEPCWNLLAWNQAASLVFGDFDTKPIQERNLMWLVYTDPAMRRLLVDWEAFARCLLVQFRADYGQRVGTREWMELVAALQRVSPEFRQWWSSHDVTRPMDWRKELDHPIVGRLSLDSVTMQLHGTANWRLVVYTPAPDTPTAAKLHSYLLRKSIAGPTGTIAGFPAFKSS
ncbi:helix-turn-helix transcriptional regulator [Scytonema sp. PRP1]|uniref:helix-turn-helix transcriptional regulator n=1 Tax=Scytonema sp. PRP1 TaxID=3120513 RepID=UPI00300D254D